MTNKIFPFTRFTVSGNSMFPTLKPGQDILVYKWAYVFIKPKVGDLVVIKHQGKEIIKRIHYILGREYFVQGDNTKESTDSRIFGAVKKENIIGKVVFIQK